MAKGGARPKPNALKLVSGSKHHNAEEPEAAGDLAAPPAGWTPAQKALWHEIATAAPRGVLTESDRFLVELAARNLAQLRSAEDLTAAQSAEMRRCLGEMGMTPAERGRLTAVKEKAKNPFSEFS